MITSAKLIPFTLLVLSASTWQLPKLTVKYPADHRAFTIALDGVDWFKNEEVMLTSGNKTYRSGSNLTQVGTKTVTGDGPWGSFEGSQVSWATDSKVDFVTILRLYSSAGVVTFTQSFPQGLEGAAFGSENGVSSGFPAFKPTSLKSPNQHGAGAQRLWMAYNGWDCKKAGLGCMTDQGQRVSVGSWDNSTSALPGGLEGSGPLAVMSNDGGSSVVISAAASFMAQSQQFNGALTYGLTGSITSVPKGFEIETMMAVGTGPNAAVRRWGDLLTSRYKKSNPYDNDFTTTHLGYATDNGAFYYWNPEKGKSYADTLLGVKDYANKAGIPYRHVQLDSWWYIKDCTVERKGSCRGGTKSWVPDLNTFPDGLASFHNKTDWRITAHNRMWSSENVYAKQNGGKYNWLIEGKEAVPLDQLFWDDLMEQGKAWGLYVYEQDWLFTEYVGTNATLQSATLPRQWLMQMGQAAEKADLVVQYCMLWPRFALQSLELPAVTTARGSTDYKAGGNDQWIMGLSSLFLDSLALRPTKDNFFTTDKQGDGHVGTEKFNRLQSVVSTMTTGPVFPSDAINCSDASLILRSCTSDGLVLKPDRAMTNMDANILDKARAVAAGKAPSTAGFAELQAAQSTIGTGSAAVTSFHVLAVNTAVGQYQVTAAELAASAAATSPGAAAPGSFVVFESNFSAPYTVSVFDNAHPLVIPATDRWSFTYHSIVPVQSNGLVFLGEADSKWVPTASQRFSKLTASGSSSAGDAAIEVMLNGTPGEKVRLFWADTKDADDSGAVSAKLLECTVGSGGSATARLPAGTCS